MFKYRDEVGTWQWDEVEWALDHIRCLTLVKRQVLGQWRMCLACETMRMMHSMLTCQPNEEILQTWLALNLRLIKIFGFPRLDEGW